KVGKPLNQYIESDVVFELEVTPNRGDCLSHIGVAREIASLLNKTISRSPISLDMNSTNIKEKLSVKILNKKNCSQYMARMIEGVKVESSPKWLQDRLIAIGLKPINNIVDATNYIMYDLGQPLHAFDASTIEGKEIIVRKSMINESIVTLDGVERKVSDSILITDKSKPLAIAGVMGGKNSEVSENTTSIVIESAEFDRKHIRKAIKTLGLNTEASYRFERGIDSGSVEYALNKAAKMVKEMAGGNILSGVARDGERPENASLIIPYDKINNFIGLTLSDSEINRILNSLSFDIKNNVCVVPLWRHDIGIWQDLAEEVARIYGYSRIEPLSLLETKPPKKSEYYHKEALKDVLVDSGFTEVVNYPYLSELDIKSVKLNTKNLLEIANPIQPENKYLRNSLVPGLLKSIAKNSSFDPILLFETGKTFSKKAETDNLGIVASGKGAKELIENVIDNICSKFKIARSNLLIDELSQDNLLKFKIRKLSVFVIEVNLDKIMQSKMRVNDAALSLKISGKKVNYRPISKFPAVTRDLAFILDKNLKSNNIESVIQETSELINRVELFDEFASDRFGVNKKNIAYHIYLQHPEKTMTDKEADQIIKSVIKNIESKFKAKLRS
ncbi:MAG: phenylalanine--tRNA ligase subunit beta, partial [Patescibacteria group bacterium]|nr:phenylalanine--tRNA ligase subunit beta [Patescibacteria group bacterium]